MAPGDPHKKEVLRLPLIVVTFQKRPGTPHDRRIKDAGSATLSYSDGTKETVKPNDGYYVFAPKEGISATFEILGVSYTVQDLAAGDEDVAGQPSITSWGTVLSKCVPGGVLKDSLRGIQERLQLLGYYTGRVDGTMGKETERAVLDFQADHGGLLVDGDPGGKTRTELKAHIDRSGKATFDGKYKNYYVVRRYLIDFWRAPTKQVGFSQADCPHPDTRSGDTPAVGCGLFQGKDKSYKARTFKVKLEAAGYVVDEAIAAKLYLTNRDHPEVAAPQGVVDPQERLMEIEAKTPGTATLEVRWRDAKGPVLAEIEAHVFKLRHLKLAVHLMEIRTAAGAGGARWTEAEARTLVDRVNAIWCPVGIRFDIAQIRVEAFNTGRVADSVTDDDGNAGTWESDTLAKAHNVAARINVYLVQQLTDRTPGPPVQLAVSNANGFQITVNGQRSLFVRRNPNGAVLARTSAHELGHMLRLAHAKQYPHSDESEDAAGNKKIFRHDIDSRSRLMGYLSQYDLRAPVRPWQNTGYGRPGAGNVYKGALITLKKLKRDSTDDEQKRAYSANPY